MGMIAFVTNMAAPFGNIWGYQYKWAGMMGNMMNFAAYLFMGIPAGKMLMRFGYKRTALTALAVGIVGLFVQYLSSILGASTEVVTVSNQPVALNLFIYLLGAFICGFCVCMLNTVANPMLNLLGGGGNRGNQFIQIGGSLNSLAGTLTPFLVGVLIGQVTKDTNMTEVAPLLFVGMGVFVVSFLIIWFVNIPEPQAARTEKIGALSPLRFRHTVLGVLAIFCYVGSEVGIAAQLNFYVTDMGFEGSAAIGGSLAGLYWLMMMFGRFASSTISAKVATRTQMAVATSLAIALLLVAIFLPESVVMGYDGHDIPVKCVFLVLCGICMSVMWGGIFNLAVEGLGKYTEAASGLFMTMVVGGGIMPLIQDFIATSTDRISSYWLPVAMILYILFFSTIGSRNVNKDIKVD